MQSKDTCFRCRQQGHWANSCPLNTPTSSPSSSFTVPDPPPAIQCRCGGGHCIVLTSRTAKNPGRKFYTCPAANDCGFFKWCDQVTSKDSEFRPGASHPMCPCGAGQCRREEAREGPNAGRGYFLCRLKERFGACGFFQWEDAQVGVIPTATEVKNDHLSATRDKVSGIRNAMDLRRAWNFSITREENRETGLETAEDSLHSSVTEEVPITYEKDAQEVESQKLDEATDISSRNLEKGHLVSDLSAGSAITVGGEAEPLSPMIDNEHRISNIVSPYDVHCQQICKRRLIVATDHKTRDNGLSGFRVNGWLGRLAFQPTWCLKHPPAMPMFCCIFPSFNLIVVPQDVILLETEESAFVQLSPKDTEPQKLLLSPREDDRPLDGAGHHTSTIHENILKENEPRRVYTGNEVGFHGSSNSPDHEEESLAETDASPASDGFLINHCPTSEHLPSVFEHATGFSEPEPFFQTADSLLHLTEQYNVEKVHFYSISHKHEEALAAFSSSCSQLKSLHKKSSWLRKVLLQIEKQLACCETETLEFAASLQDISKELLESQKRMQAASEKLTEAVGMFKPSDLLQTQV